MSFPKQGRRAATRAAAVTGILSAVMLSVASAALADPSTQLGARAAAIVYRPPGLSTASKVPLVLALYGSGGCPQCMQGQTNFERVAREHGFVIAYPGAMSNPPWNSTGDMSYLSSFISQTVAGQNIDPSRVYVTGFSAGARMAYQVGCQLSNQVAAVASVSGVMRVAACKLARPISVLTIDGSTESGALQGTNTGIPPASFTALQWRTWDGCPTHLFQASSVSGPVVQQTWGSCVDGSAVGLYVVQGGHHAWPGAYGETGPDAPGQYDASETVWAFFAQHSGGSLTRPNAKLVSVRVTGKGKNRRLYISLTIGEYVAVTETIVAHRKTLGSGIHHAAQSGALAQAATVPVSIKYGLPRGIKRGRYQLQMRVQDSYGRAMTVTRTLSLPA
jgi:polyhydroxybutyrate depolymerase